jgi:hypothetical protein
MEWTEIQHCKGRAKTYYQVGQDRFGFQVVETEIIRQVVEVKEKINELKNKIS